MKCASAKCEQEATWTFTWPGSEEQLACERHVMQAAGLATHMGFHLPVGGSERILELECLAAAEAVHILAPELPERVYLVSSDDGMQGRFDR